MSLAGTWNNSCWKATVPRLGQQDDLARKKCGIHPHFVVSVSFTMGHVGMYVCLKQSKQLIASLSQPFKADGTKKEVVIARDCSLVQAIYQMSRQKCSLES